MATACRDEPLLITISNKTDITSPNYPKLYDNNMDCEWIVLTNEDREIKLMPHERSIEVLNFHSCQISVAQKL